MSIDPQAIDEDAIVRDIMARGQAAKQGHDIPEDLLPYDFELLEIEKVMTAINAKMGKVTDLENFRKEIVGRFAEINWHCEVEVYSTNADGVYLFAPQLIGRINPINREGTDYERRQWEVRNDILDIAPEFEKGETVPFSEAMVHNPDLAQD